MATAIKRISDDKIVIECTVEEATEIQHALTFTAAENCELNPDALDYYKLTNRLSKLLADN